MQGRRAESRALMIEIHERFPDYFFGRTNVAALAVQDGDLERARQLLAPALIQGRYHVSELSALCRTQIALLVAEEQIDGASPWLDIWMQLVGDDPQQKCWTTRLAMERLKGLSFKILMPGKRGKRSRLRARESGDHIARSGQGGAMSFFATHCPLPDRQRTLHWNTIANGYGKVRTHQAFSTLEG